jgi:hypothetical protein
MKFYVLFMGGVFFKVTKEDYFRKINKMVENMKDDDENELVRFILNNQLFNHIYEIFSLKHQFQLQQQVDQKLQSIDNQFC